MSNARTILVRAARVVGLAAVLSAATGSLVAFAATADAAPGAPVAGHEGMHGNPAAVAPYWRYQQQDRDCGEMAVADVVGQVTGHEPSEDEITAAARTTASRPARSTPASTPWPATWIRGAR
ncbi:hypothetical protein AWC11_12280 [Mycobacterium interjectum]|nr:hypothetical protein AWC11_12280 [Mycobacterium interjectum]